MSNRPTNMKAGNNVYWTIMTYNSTGTLVDADSLPTISIRKNGAATSDIASVIKRSSSTGTYDVVYSPAGEVEGDCFLLEETATINASDYINGWNLEVLAAERGTDNASTFNPSSDTVSYVGSVAVCSTNVDMRGTDGANTIAPATPADVAGMSTFDASTDTVTTDSASRDASKADVSGLSTFNVASDAVITDTASRNASKADVSGLSTFDPSSDLVVTDTASRNASKADVSGLSTFDATSDQVVASNMRGTDNANTVAPDNAAIQAISGEVSDLYGNQSQWLTADVSGLATQSSIDSLNDFDPSSDVVARVSLVDTTTSNSDMRGTNNGLLSDEAPNNFSIMLVDSSGKVTTSNPAAGSGSSHTAQDVANLILAVPTTPLGNTATGSISLVDTVTTVTNSSGGSGGDSAADIYSYFTSDNREDAFQADVSQLATTSQLNGVNSGINMSIAQLNDFNPTTDVVANVNQVQTTVNLTNDVEPSDIYNYFVGSNRNNSFKADTSQLATTSELNSTQSVIVGNISNLNDFDPNSDIVAHVTLVDTTTNLTNGGSGGGGGGDATLAKQNEIIADIAALNDFSPSDDVVAHVTLVDTTTNLTNGSGGGNGGGTTILRSNPTPRAF
jgi:hypothetical protein